MIIKRFVFLLFGLLSSAACLSQNSRYFSFADTSVSVGQIHKLQILYELDKAKIKPETMPSVDSLYKFMVRNAKVRIEIDVHSDSRPNRSCSKPTQNRAQSIADSLIKKGISINRIIAKGWGEKKLLISDEQIKKVKNKQEQEILHARNRRTEIKIIAVD
jgi:peptidoglycan-associated lipoprotein